MDFEVKEEHKLIAKLAEEVSRRFPVEYWREKEEKKEFAKEFWNAIVDAGFTGAIIPEEYGGSGLDVQALMLIMENLTKGGAGLAGTWYLMLTEVFTALPITRYGTREQKDKYLPKIAKGEFEGCMALTEPEAGSNTLAITTRAVKDGDEYVVNGRKIFISGADRARIMLLVTRTSSPKEKRTKGITLFLVELPNKSVECRPIPKHGINYSNTCELSIEDLRLGEDDILGPKDYGWYVLLDVLNPERIGFAIGSIGTAELALEKAIEYSKTRIVFGKQIGSYQGLQHPIAEAYATLQGARLLAYKAAWIYDNKNPPPPQDKVRDPKYIYEKSHQYREVGKYSNMAKVVAVENAIKAVYWAMQMFGGLGYAKETDVERWWREINLLRIAPVSQQVALNYIAHHVLGMPKSY